MCLLCSQLYAGGDGATMDSKKYKYTIADFGTLSVRPLHLDSIYEFQHKTFTSTTVGTYLYSKCLDNDEVQTNDLTVIELDQHLLEMHSVEFIVNDEANTIFKPADLDLLKNDWIQHRAQFEGVPITAEEEKTWSNEGKVKFTQITNFTLDAENQKLIIPLPEGVVVKPGQQFILRTKSSTAPNDYDLEGMYFDQAPKDCPPQMITQLQQYGYRKLTPTIDQMPSKCAYTTNLIADGRYTALLSNGDLAPGFFFQDELTQLVQPLYQAPSSYFPSNGGDEAAGFYKDRKVLRYHVFDLMATYLFFLGIGTYISYSRDVEYPLHPEDPINVERKAAGQQPLENHSFRIDLVTAPDLFDHVYCAKKLEVVRGAVMWFYLSGPSNGNTEHKETRKQIYELIEQREALKDKLGMGQYNVYAHFKQISHCTEENEEVKNATAINPIIGKYQKQLKQGEEGPQHMKKPVSSYYQETYPLTIAQDNTDEKAQTEAELAAIRTKLFQLISSIPFDALSHRYKRQIYREIGMEVSAIGGLESTSNTTILSSRLTANPLLSDGAFIYMFGVTIHEYIHDLNGSLVTGQSPFTIWLNEAVTVMLQRKYENSYFGFDLMRSQQLAYANAPSSGPLAVDSAPNAMPIIPDGFNEAMELISAMTYSKAPEITQTFERLMGSPLFYKGLTLYYNRFANSNAKSEDWVNAMIEVSGDQGLAPMAEKWFKESGHPTINYSGQYNAETKQYTLSLSQTGWEHHTKVPGPWRFGVEIELFGPSGEKLLSDDIKKGCSCRTIDSTPGEVYLYDMKDANADVVFDNISVEPLFASVSRGWSSFSKTKNISSNKEKELLAQIKYDDDAVAKMFAWANYKEPEVARLTKAYAEAIKANGQGEQKPPEGVVPSDDWIKLHAAVLFDSSLSPSARASILDESGAACTDESVSFEYFAINDALTALFQGLWAKYSTQLVELYNELNAPSTRKWPLENGFAQRPLKRHLINIFSRVALYKPIFQGVTPYPSLNDAGLDLFSIAQTLVFDSDIMSDKVLGLSLAMNAIFAVYQLDQDVLDKFVLITPSVDENKAKQWTPSISQCQLTTNDIPRDQAVEFLTKAETFFIAHPTSLEMYVSVVGGIGAVYGEGMIRQLLKKPYFLIGSPLHSRTLCRSWSTVRPRAVLTKDGLELTKFLALKIGKVANLSALAMFQVLRDLNKFDDERKATITAALEDMLSQFDPVKDLTLASTIETLLGKK